ncbi:hypothetical protein V1477_002150 [Vespula maculifrons]|uniref:Uncharacterized protein n=1 Tax=Vespula maculifrons TaxID=7453 RepID=A0ABD2CX50_VESMC
MTLYSARTKKKPQMSHMRVSVRKLTSISLFCSDKIWKKMPKNGDGCLAKTFLNHKIFDFVKKKIVDFRDIKFNERNSANQIMNNQNTVVNLQLNQIEGIRFY